MWGRRPLCSVVFDSLCKLPVAVGRFVRLCQGLCFGCAGVCGEHVFEAKVEIEFNLHFPLILEAFISGPADSMGMVVGTFVGRS